MKLHDHIARAPRIKTGRIKHRLAAYIQDWGESERTNEMSTVTMSNMNASGIARPAQLQDNHDNLNLGEKITGKGIDPTKVSPAPNAVHTGVTDGMATDATAVSDMITVKRDSYTQLQGRGAGPSSVKATKDGTTPAIDAIKNAGCPREQMKGQQNSKFYNENGKAFTSTPVGLDSDAGN